ncbi:hypothetical protein [Nocardia sp. NBC_01327]|uniref:hypothetical protein n=1 Tax=Nocardia sp. NBC_01327 TaxID=2903593 RepID=UPI002E13FC06|nr:hypothetical protein OG326_21065 [Nocardia sp. NBC_01327]
MAEAWDGTDLIADGFEYVSTESERCDWPRAGLATVDGRPHYYNGWSFDYLDEGYEYYVWPANAEAVAWELEQWAIWVRWHQLREAGQVGEDSHPGHGGVDARYDELTELLAPYRRIPDEPRKLLAERRYDNGDSYRIEGTDMWFRWTPSTSA